MKLGGHKKKKTLLDQKATDGISGIFLRWQLMDLMVYKCIHVWWLKLMMHQKAFFCTVIQKQATKQTNKMSSYLRGDICLSAYWVGCLSWEIRGLWQSAAFGNDHKNSDPWAACLPLNFQFDLKNLLNSANSSCWNKLAMTAGVWNELGSTIHYWSYETTYKHIRIKAESECTTQSL